MAKNIWLSGPKRKPASKVTESTKARVTFLAKKLIEAELKPKFIEPPPKDHDWNYVVDIYTKWHGQYFYFCAKYNCPGPNAIEPSFETKSARLEYFTPNRYNLAFRRHNGKWFEIGYDMTLEECLDDIATSGFYVP